jgi:hypothetical protein
MMAVLGISRVALFGTKKQPMKYQIFEASTFRHAANPNPEL